MDQTSPINTRHRAPSHKEYLETLHIPSPIESQRISEIQSQKEHENIEKYNTPEIHNAAKVIQRSYRGHRERRQLEGLTLDPSSRWIELVKEWRYQNAIAPHRRLSSPDRVQSPSETAQANWRRAGEIAQHAVAAELESGTPAPSSTFESKRSKRSTSRAEPPDSMLLDLRYFLEMVDVKHRYGANLQVYHEEWQRSASDQNFFFWLDHGAGRHVDLMGCSRAKLEKERIRYLSKEERKNYLVGVDEKGLLRWAKNDELITTSVDHYQDSAVGIIPKGSTGPGASDPQSPSADVSLTSKVSAVGGLFRDTVLADSASQYEDDSSSIASSSSSNAAHGELSAQPAAKKKKPHRRLFVSPATILNSLLRASVKPGTWIYVADTVGRLYVGIKASGAFQHASFLSGARISSAGIVGIEEGKLIYLSPLSGHYRPTTKSFKKFIASLRDQNVNLSALKVSKAYAVLLGMEVYGKSKKDISKVMHPHDEVKREERRKRKASRASAIRDADSALLDDSASATEVIERRWKEEHERRGLTRLLGDLHVKTS